MTKIIKDGIYLDPDIHRKMGSPGYLGFVREHRNVYLIPFLGTLAVSARNNKLFLPIPTKYRHLLKIGTFDAAHVNDKWRFNSYLIIGGATLAKDVVEK